MAKYIYNGKMSEMDFSVHHKYSPKKIIKFEVQKIFRVGKLNGNWIFYIMLRALYFELYNNSRDHETKLAYALSLEHQATTLHIITFTWHAIQLIDNDINVTNLDLHLLAWNLSKILLSKHFWRSRSFNSYPWMLGKSKTRDRHRAYISRL